MTGLFEATLDLSNEVIEIIESSLGPLSEDETHDVRVFVDRFREWTTDRLVDSCYSEIVLQRYTCPLGSSERKDTTKENKTMFNNNRHNGFQMTFENGWTISVQWTWMNYCDRQLSLEASDPADRRKEPFSKSPNAEIAMWDENGKWYDFGGDQVRGWVTPDEVVEWMNLCRSL